MFDRPGIFYFNDPFTIFNKDWALDQNKVNALQQHEFIIADFSSEHYGIDGLTEIYDFLQQNGLNFILLSHEPSDHQILSRMFFYPYWYYHSMNKFEKINFDTTRNYKLGCLNASPRPHRMANWLVIKDHPQKDKILMSFYKGFTTRSDDIILTDSELQQWESVQSILPAAIAGRDANNSTICLDQLINSYLHLVTETTVIPRIFITEKTWKPIAAGNLFLIFGNRGSVKYLRDQGVDVFDDIVDHSYDAEPNWRRRMEKIHKTIDNLLQQDLRKIFEDTLDRRRLNRDRFFNGEFDQIYQSSIMKFLNNNVSAR